MKHHIIPMFLSVSMLTSSTLLADPASIVAKLKAPAPGLEAIVLYLDAADTNKGTGGSGLTATAGDALVTNTGGPWGQISRAFGPAKGAALGAAIAESEQTELLSGDTGAVVFLVKFEDARSNGLLLSRGAWGDGVTFDLRPKVETKEIELWSAPAGSEPQPFSLGNYVEAQWMFVGMSWKKEGDEVSLETFLAGLDGTSNPQHKSFLIPTVGNPSKPVQIGGRSKPGLEPVVFHGGSYWGLAIYDQPLSMEIFEELVAAMQEEAGR